MGCQRCGHRAVASCTGKTSDLFGMKWPGGKEQWGYVPPHDLIGLREGGASSDYVNFSWCLVCGQIQGEWPVKSGQSYLDKYAPKRYWEVIVCPAMEEWFSMYFLAKTKEEVEEKMDGGQYGGGNTIHFWVHEVCEETTIPEDAEVEEL